MNTFSLIGHTIGEPDSRDTQNGVFICKLTIETTELAKGQAFKNIFRLTGFNDVALKMKDILPSHLVFASGSMRNSFFEKDGQKIQRIDFIVKDFHRIVE
jgi:single-stranded DNA-binding protein